MVSKVSGSLSPATLQILLALASGDLHGYGIIQEVRRNSDGLYKMGPGTLYDNLKKLLISGLVAELPAKTHRIATANQEDRRFFTLTKQGREALTTEVDRLQNIVSKARSRLREAKAGRA